MCAQQKWKNRWTFKSNLALTVSYHSVKFQIDQTKSLKLESENQNILDECNPKTGTQTNPNFKSNLALVVSNHPVKFQDDWTKRL